MVDGMAINAESLLYETGELLESKDASVVHQNAVRGFPQVPLPAMVASGSTATCPPPSRIPWLIFCESNDKAQSLCIFTHRLQEAEDIDRSAQSVWRLRDCIAMDTHEGHSRIRSMEEECTISGEVTEDRSHELVPEQKKSRCRMRPFEAGTHARAF